MGLKKTVVKNETLQVVADDDGVGALGMSQTQTECRQYDARVISITKRDNTVVVQVDASPLFPGGGGQPADRGWVNGALVLEVVDHEHLVLEQSPNAETVLIEVDWARRFELMQQHTAQHVISSLALKEFGWSTLSFHLSMDSAFVVFDVDALLPGDILSLEDRTNAVIREGRSVRPRLATERDFESGKIRCRKLPDKRSGGLRLVEIDGMDLNTCGGTHVSNTAALQMIRLTKVEPHRGAVRVYFEAGERILTRLRHDALVHHQVNQPLSCSVEQYSTQIERIQRESKSTAKRIKFLEMSGAEHEAQTAVIRAETTETLIVTDNKDMGQLNRMAQILTKRDAEQQFILLSRHADNDWMVLMAAQQAWIDHRGRSLLTRLEARGGGGKGRLQGRTTSGSLVLDYIEEMKAKLGVQS